MKCKCLSCNRYFYIKDEVHDKAFDLIYKLNKFLSKELFYIDDFYYDYVWSAIQKAHSKHCSVSNVTIV